MFGRGKFFKNSFSLSLLSGITSVSAIVAYQNKDFLWNQFNSFGNKNNSKYAYDRRLDEFANEDEEEYEEQQHLEIRTLTPPKIFDSEKHILHLVPCTRPAREGGVRLESEFVPSIGRTIYHNYSHSGAGYSVGVGCVELLLKEEFDIKNIEDKENVPIAIVGAGLIGKMTALKLFQRGYNNLTMYSDQQEDLTSHKAAGLLGVFALDSDSSSENKRRMNIAAVESMRFFLNVLKGRVNELHSTCVRRIPRYMGSREIGCDCDLYVDAHLMKPAKKVLIKFASENNNENNKNEEKVALRKTLVYDDAVFVDAPKIMEQLDLALTEKGIKRRENYFVTSLHEVSTGNEKEEQEQEEENVDGGTIPSKFKYVFNATGAGAQELVQDKKCQRVGGHVILLKNQTSNNTPIANYVVDFVSGHDFEVEVDSSFIVENSENTPTTTNKTKNKRKVSPLLYYVPKGEGGLIGGTCVFDMEKDECFDGKEFDRILQDAKDLFYGSERFNVVGKKDTHV